MSVALGIRNSNPLNIRRSKYHWVGMRKTQDDPGFVQFESEHYGIRAGAKNLLTYYRKHKRKTIRAIISAWAPPSDNNPTNAYMRTVASALRVSPDDEIDLENRDTMIDLVSAMIAVECGSNPYARAVIKAGVDAAYDTHSVPQAWVQTERPAQVIDEDLDPDAETLPYPIPQHKPTPPASPVSPAPPTRVTVIEAPVPPPAEPVAPAQPIPTPVPATGTPVLVDQPSSLPSRKVVAGGLGGAIAFIIAILWGKYQPDNPMPPEYALAIGTALATAFSFAFSYITRERAVTIAVCPPGQPTPPAQK